MTAKNWDDLVVQLEQDPDGAPPQRGALGARHAWHLKTVLQTATTIGEKVLGIRAPLEQDIERTPDRVEKFDVAIRTLVQSGAQLGDFSADQFGDLVSAELFGFGPLDRFLAEAEITEVMVNGPWVVFVERKGKLEETGHKFFDDAHVERVIRRITRPLGRAVGPENPLVDARLPDGSRVNAVVFPCTLDGPSITIRKFSRSHLSVADLVAMDAMSPHMARFLSAVVEARLNVVVAGGTGSGKTTLINALSEFIPDGERVVTIEDTAELKLVQRDVVRLESKKGSVDSPVTVTVRACVANALRMRPDRIIVGECRGAEALDMLQAMNTGHQGSMTTVHANSPRDAISRLETLSMMGGLDLPLAIIRRQIASAVQYLVQTSRQRDGARKVTHITEVQGMEGPIVTMSDIFLFKDEGLNEQGHVVGTHHPTGNRPNCMEHLALHGLTFPPTFFSS